MERSAAEVAGMDHAERRGTANRRDHTHHDREFATSQATMELRIRSGVHTRMATDASIHYQGADLASR